MGSALMGSSAKLILFDRGTFGVLPLTYVYLPLSLSLYIYICVYVTTGHSFVRNQGVLVLQQAQGDGGHAGLLQKIIQIANKGRPSKEQSNRTTKNTRK